MNAVIWLVETRKCDMKHRQVFILTVSLPPWQDYTWQDCPLQAERAFSDVTHGHSVCHYQACRHISLSMTVLLWTSTPTHTYTRLLFLQTCWCVATSLFWIFRTPSLLSALPFLVLQTCFYCAGPKGHSYNNYYQRKLFYFWSSIHVKYTTCKTLFCICFIQFWMRRLPAVCTYLSNPVRCLYQYSPPAYPQMWLNGDQTVREWGCGGSL